MKQDKPTQEQKDQVKKIKEFNELEILDTWFEDIYTLEEEIKEKQKHLRKAKQERKKQPNIHTTTIITKEEGITPPGYQIIIGKNNQIFFDKDW